TIVSPYSTYQGAVLPGGKKGSFGEELRNQFLDIKAPTAAQVKGQKQGQQRAKTEAKTRLRKPRGLIEYGASQYLPRGYHQAGEVEQADPDDDYAGARAAGVQPDERGHLPDTFKLPNHITFSTGSKYHGVGGNEGGVWDKLPASPGTPEEHQPWMFTPGRTN